MKVYTLIGRSGSGKSFQANNLCRKKHIDAIIDDGLFIYKNHVMAGVSAKKVATSVGAIKTAIFADESHRVKVRDEIRRVAPVSILIISTSKSMTDKIISRLELPRVDEVIRIEDVTTDKQREIAKTQRDVYGKHVIPVPTLQLKRDFAGYFLDPIKLIYDLTYPSKNFDGKFSVVRPTYSYMGDFFISDTVFKDIAICVAEEIPGIESVVKVYENTSPDCFTMDVVIKVAIGTSVFEVAGSFQKKLAEAIEFMTAYNVAEINLEVR